MSNPISYADLFNGMGPGAEELLNFTKNVRSLNTSYKTFSKNVEGDAGKIAANLGQILKSIDSLRESAKGSVAINKQDQQRVLELDEAVRRLSKDCLELKAQQAGLTKVQKDTEAATKGVTSALKQQQDALKKAFAEGNITAARQAAAAIVQLKSEATELNRAMRGVNSDFTAAAGSFNNLQNETRKLDARLRAMEGGLDNTSKEAVELKAQITANNQKIREFNQNLGLGYSNVGRYAESLREAVGELQKERTELQANALALRNQAQASGLSAEAQERLQKEIRDTDAALDKNTNSLRGYGVQVQQGKGLTAGLSAGMGGLAQSLLGSYYGIQGLATALQEGFKLLYDYSDASADVRKNTGQTKQEFEEMVDVLKTIPTRTPLSGLLEEAKIGGQLGKTKDEIVGFVRSIDTIVVALGDDFQGGVEEISNSLGTLELIFKKSLGPDQEKNLLNIGNALNQLSADGRATAPFLSDVAQRVGNVAANVNLGIAPVLAFAAVLQENGVQAEVAGSSLNRLFSTISNKRTEAFRIAKFADNNLTLKEFSRLINTDFEKALQLFLQGLKAGGTTTTRFNDLLGTLKLSSGEAKAAITTLANNTELLAARQKTANEQLRDGTSVLDEYATKTDSVASSVDQLVNNFKNFFTKGVVGDLIKSVVDDMRYDLADLQKGLDKVGQAYDFIKGKAQQAGIIKAAPVERDAYSPLGAKTKAMLQEADTADKLLGRYQELSAKTSITADEQRELSTVMNKLQTTLKTTVTYVDKESGALKLNVGATADAIIAKRQLVGENEALLQQSVNDTKEAIAATTKLLSFKQNDVGIAKLKLADTGISDEDLKKLSDAMAYREKVSKFLTIPVKETQELRTFPKAQKDAYEALTAAEKKLLEEEERLKKQKRDLANAEAALASVRKAGLPVTQQQQQQVQDDLDLDKKKKQSVADVAAEEYKLQKQRLEAQAADYARQAGNVANTEEVRLRALEKERDVRKQIAKLDENEGGRLAAESNKDKINGDRATLIVKQAMSEKYAQEVQQLNQKLSKDEIALHNSTLDALAAVDRVSLEEQQRAAEKVRDDVNKTYEERQEAARDAADYQIALAQLVRDAEIRAAQGSADAIKAANDKFEVSKRSANRGVKFFDSEKAIDDIEKVYSEEQNILEDARTKGLITERQYHKELEKLEYQREYAIIAALEREYGATKEVADRKLALKRKYTAAELEEDQKAYDKRIELAQQGLDFINNVGGAYFAIQSDRISREQEMNEVKYRADSENAGENAALKQQADERYHKRKNQLAVKAFQQEKKAALFSIAINTAMGVTSVLATGGPAHWADFGVGAALLIAGVVAGGLAQAAVVLAKQPPIPEYFKGSDYVPQSGPAWVAERGPELIEGRSGGMRLVSKPTITHLEQGSKVYTADETRRMLTEAPQLGQLGPHSAASQKDLVAMQRYTADLQERSGQYFSPFAALARNAGDNEQLARLIGAVVEKGIAKVWANRTELVPSERGFRQFIYTANSRTELLNKRLGRP